MPEKCCLSSRFYFSVNKKKEKGFIGGAAFKRKKCKMHFSQLLRGRLLIMEDLRGFFFLFCFNSALYADKTLLKQDGRQP